MRGRIKKRERASSLFIAGYYKLTNLFHKKKKKKIIAFLSFVIGWQLKCKDIFKTYATRWKTAEGKVEVSYVSYGYVKRCRYIEGGGRRSGISWPRIESGETHTDRDRESLVGERRGNPGRVIERTAHPVPVVSGLFSASTSLSVSVSSPLLPYPRKRARLPRARARQRRFSTSK